MFPKRFASISGGLLLIAGVVSFIPSLVGSRTGLVGLNVESSYGLFLGLFPLNIINKIAMILFGAAGLYAGSVPFKNLPASITYARLLFYSMAALTVLGLFSQTNTLMGYWPLYGNNVWASAIIGLSGAIYGFGLTAKVNTLITHRKQMKTAHGLR